MFLTVGGLFETLATFLPLPCTVLFLNLARGNQHIQSILARIRAYNQQCIFVVDHVQAALLQGVWCPGLDSIASGMLLFDRGQRPLHAAILDRFGLSAEHAVDLRPLVRGFSLQNDATPMVAWHCGNRVTPAWILLLHSWPTTGCILVSFSTCSCLRRNLLTSLFPSSTAPCVAPWSSRPRRTSKWTIPIDEAAAKSRTHLQRFKKGSVLQLCVSLKRLVWKCSCHHCILICFQV